jgi:xanthine dehydrogenase molybdopterin-binding subunit B
MTIDLVTQAEELRHGAAAVGVPGMMVGQSGRSNIRRAVAAPAEQAKTEDDIGALAMGQ